MHLVSKSAAPVGRVLVIHSWWGLTRSFFDYADRLAGAGYAVGLSDLFNGRTAQDEAEAQRLRRAPRRHPMYRTLLADSDALLQVGDPADRSLTVIGFSMGGHRAVWLSQRPDLPLRNCVLSYAARGGSFAGCQARVLAHFAGTDPWVSASARRGMERALDRAGCRYRAWDYPGTGHWFAETAQGGAYDPGAADPAFDRTLVHLTGP